MNGDARDEALSVAADAVALMTAAGATDAEATVTIVDGFACAARDHAVTKLEGSRSRILGVRAFAGRRRTSFTTNDLSRAAISALAARATVEAALVPDDPYGGLPESFAGDGVTDRDLLAVAADVAARDDEEKIGDALELERLVRADARITNSNASHVSDSIVTTALVNTRGFRGVTQGTSVSRAAAPVARDGDGKRMGRYGTTARGWAAAEPVAAVAMQAARRALQLCGARRPPTMRVPVIFEREVAGRVVADIFPPATTANVALGNSWLAGRIGERVGSELVTVIDDGRLRGGLGSAPFDGEGTATRETVVLDRGVLRAFLSDVYWGRRTGVASTGNAANGGVYPNNFYLQAGSGTLDELVAATARGILVLELNGAASEHASGNYSRGACGIMIEDGVLCQPVDQFTIASTLQEMLAGIDAVAGDLRFSGAVAAPSFRVAEMTISGSGRM